VIAIVLAVRAKIEKLRSDVEVATQRETAAKENLNRLLNDPSDSSRHVMAAGDEYLRARKRLIKSVRRLGVFVMSSRFPVNLPAVTAR
jgi:hypothetical protein